jgi:hypothetical protein
MTLRSRPVLDRKHRPRWQDELRTQQLIVVGFAIAIAVAIGIFGAAAWNGYWETHSRPIADVAGTSFNKADLDQRETILTMELVANLQELQGQLTGGPRDQIINQQIEQLNSQASGLTTTAAISLVDGEVLASRAGDFDVSVSDTSLPPASRGGWRSLSGCTRTPSCRGPSRGRGGRLQPIGRAASGRTHEAQPRRSGSREARTSQPLPRM